MSKSQSAPIVLNKPIETKAAKFFRIVLGTEERLGRIDKLLRGLDNLGNCFNRNYYDYTDDQSQKVFSALRKKIDDIESISRQQSKKRDRFHF